MTWRSPDTYHLAGNGRGTATLKFYEGRDILAEGDSKQKAAAMMQQAARLFEAGIRAHPQDWHMLQKVFVADLDPGRLRRASAGS